MSKVVLDASMSLGRVRRPVRMSGRQSRWGTAANACTHGWPGTGPTPEHPRRACAERWTRPVGATVIGRRTFDSSAWARGAARHGRVFPASWSPIAARPDLLGDNGGMFAFDALEARQRISRRPLPP